MVSPSVVEFAATVQASNDECDQLNGLTAALVSVVSRRSVTLRLGRHAVDHLVALGHGEIAYVDGGDNLGADLRRDGYRTAVADHGLHDQIRVALGGYTEGQSASARGDGLSDDFRSWMAT